MLEHFEEDLDLILNNTSPYWVNVRNSTIFISGGTGFFGLWLQMSFIYINKKLNLNSKLIVLTRNKDKFLNLYPWIAAHPEIAFLEGDIRDFEFIDEKVDYIIHAATEASIKLNQEAPLVMFETIVYGTRRILEFAKQKKVKSFLLTSSGAVYGKQPPFIKNVSEDYSGAPMPSDPSSAYGEGKRMSELLCAIYYKQFQVPVKIARCYAFLGPLLPLDSHFAVGNFIKDLLKGEDIKVESDGTSIRSYMYSADLTIWLWTILFSAENNRPYNIGSASEVSIAELAKLVSEYNLEKSNVIIKELPDKLPPQRYVPDVTRANDELGLGLFTDLETSLKKTINFYKLFGNFAKTTSIQNTKKI